MFKVTFLLCLACIATHETSGQRRDAPRTSGGTRPWRLTALANKLFAHRLFRTTARNVDASQNFFVSPYAVSAGLSMTLYGAQDTTAKQIMDTLGYSELELIGNFNKNRVPRLYLKLLDQVFRRNHGFALVQANRLFGERSETYVPAFLDGTERYYGARLMEMDFVNDPSESRRFINSWVANVTNNTIEDALPPSAVTSATKLVLVSTLYFRGDWEKPFDPARTRQSIFYAPGEEIPMNFMTGSFNKVLCVEADEIESLIIELPYRTSSLNYKMVMELVVPLARSPSIRKDIENRLTETVYDFYNRRKSNCSIHLTMPKFRLDFGKDLRDILEEMGIEDLFIPGVADLSGINNQRTLNIDAAEHKTFLEVNEAGTTAGASFSQTQTKSAPRYVNVNHPFYIILKEKHTKMPLFMGRITRPTPI